MVVGASILAVCTIGLASLYKRQKDFDKKHPLTGSVKRRGNLLRSMSGIDDASLAEWGGSVIDSQAR